MPNTGNLFPGTAETVARGAGTAWPTPSNALSDNATDTICASGGSGSAYLVLRNFGAALAVGDTVGGITIRVEASEHSGGTEVLSAQLQDNTGALIGTAKTVTLSGVSKAIYTYGAITDVWGATLTQTIVNSPNFGVRLWFTTTHDVRIDFVTAAVEYALAPVPGEGGGPFPPGVFPGPIFPGPIFPGSTPGEDVTAALPSVTSTASVGTIGPNFHKTLPGVQISAAVGFITAENNRVAVLSGVSASVAVGTVSLASSRPITGVTASIAVGSIERSDVVGIPLTGVRVNVGTGYGGSASWGTSWGDSWAETWGSLGVVFDNGIGIVLPSHQVTVPGVQTTARIDDVSKVRIQPLTGVSLQAQLGLIIADPNAGAVLSGVLVTATVGSVLVPLTGNAVTVSAGTVVVSLAKGLTTVVSTATLGTLVTNRTQALSGVTAQVTIGSLTTSRTAGITTVTANVIVGSLGASRSVTLTGVSFSVEKFPLQGNQVSVAVGNLTAIPVLAGVQVTANVGFMTAGADALANLTGVSVTVEAGTLGVGERFQEFSGVVVTANVGSLVVDEALALSNVQATVNVGTLVPIPDREAALTGVSVAVAAGFITGQSDVVGILTSVAVTDSVGILEVLRIKALDGVTLSAAVGTIAPISDREQALTGVVVNVLTGYIQRDAIPLTGVSLSAAVESLGQPLLIKTLPSVSVTVTIGHTPKEGDVILDTLGVVVGAGLVGILGVIPSMPIGSYRHVAPGPARNGRIRDLEELEREMALMEE